MSLWDWLVGPSGLAAHGSCLNWAPGLLALHAGSDAIIGLSYLSISLALATLLKRRRDRQYRWILVLFSAFILTGVATHLMSVLTLWVPVYGLEGVIKAMAALAAITTAIALWLLIPKLVALPSPAQLERLNREQQRTLAENEETHALLKENESRFRAANLELERRVAEQTAELTAANQQMARSLEQRDVLIREVYHRVKNNLQTMDALMSMHSRRLNDPAAKDALFSLRQRVHALGLVHQQLMESKDMKTFDIAPFLRDLCNNVVEGGAQQGVKLSVQSIPLVVGIDFAIPLGLLVTELVTNSLKHAFPDGVGNIAVILERSGEHNVALIVSDDGKGLPEEIPFASQPGRGINIITGLVNQLRGTLVMQGENGTRTEIYVDAPVMS